MSTNTETQIEEIEVDLPDDLVCQIIDIWVQDMLSPASVTYFDKAMSERQQGDPLYEIYAAVGKSVTNEILLDVLKEAVAREDAAQQVQPEVL